MAGVVRLAIAVASGGTGSLSIPSAACSSGVTCSWKTGPPLAASSSQARPGAAGGEAARAPPPPPLGGGHAPHALDRVGDEASRPRAERRTHDVTALELGEGQGGPGGGEPRLGGDPEAHDPQRHADPGRDLEGAGAEVHHAHGALEGVVGGGRLLVGGGDGADLSTQTKDQEREVIHGNLLEELGKATPRTATGSRRLTTLPPRVVG